MTNNSNTAGRRIYTVARFSSVRDAIRLSAAVRSGAHPSSKYHEMRLQSNAALAVRQARIYFG